MNAQSEAILALARSRGLLGQNAGLDRLERPVVEKLVRDLGRMRFRCPRCRLDLTYEKLVSLGSLVCNRCSVPLTASEGASKLTTSRTRLAQAKEIGPYRLTKLIGKGASGVVHLATKEGLERDFALKILATNTFEDQTALKRFLREAQVASRLQHPGIVQVVDVGEAQGLHYLVMEYVKGPTLQVFLGEKAPLAPKDAALLVGSLARAIAFAHEHDVIHRDLKPANVILDETTGKPRITDFGLARDERDHKVTRTGEILGTPYYMSPEQFTADVEIDARADIFALGVILFEALTAQRPFEAKTAAMLATLVLNAELRSPSELVPGVPPALDAIVRKALARDRDRRYRTAAALADDLERFRAGEKVAAPPETAIAKTVRKSRRHVSARALVLPALVLGAAGGALVYSLARGGVKAAERGGYPDGSADKSSGEASTDLARLLDAKDASVAKIRVEVEKRGDLPPRLAERWAALLLRSGCYAEALRVATPLTKDAACATSATRTAAEADAKLGQLALAASVLVDLAARDPAAKARRLSFERRHDEAAEAAIAALPAQPTDASLLRTAAVALVRRGGSPPLEAMKYAQEALDLEPQEPDSHVAWACVACASGKPPEAVEAELDRAFALTAPEPPDPLAFLVRGWAALLRHEPTRAKAALEKALAVLREDPEALALLFAAKLESGGEEEALEARRRARAAAPAVFEAALDELARRLRGTPAFPLGPEARERIEKLLEGADPEARGPLRRALVAAGEGASSDACDEHWRLAKLLAPQDARTALLHSRYLVGRDRKESQEAILAARKLGAEALELDRLESDRLWRTGRVSRAAEIWARLAADKGPEGDYARVAHALHSATFEQETRALESAIARAPDRPELRRLHAYDVLVLHPLVGDNHKRPAIADARRALQLEGALDVENAFLAEYGEWALGIGMDEARAGQAGSRPEFYVRLDELLARYAALAPDTSRYGYFLFRLAAKFPATSVVALGKLEEAHRRDPEPWFALGQAFLVLRDGVGKQGLALDQAIEQLEDALHEVRRQDSEFWIPREILWRIQDATKKPVPEALKNTLPKLP